MGVANLQALSFGVLVSLTIVSLLPAAALAAQTDPYKPTQVAAPFTEMLDGVYVAYQWWSDSGSEKGGRTGPLFPVEPVKPVTEITNYPVERVDIVDYPYFPLLYVEDTYGNPYWILEETKYSYSFSWSFSNLLVTILLDPDGSYMKWLSEIRWFDTPELVDMWGFFWGPDEGALTGDEVFIFSSFSLSEYNSSYYYKSNYTWFDESNSEVDPNTVIPNLAEGYSWAAWMNQSYEYDYDWSFTGYGFDVNEMFSSDTETQWMNHYFSGMTSFNDTNGNGIMDIVYERIGYDYDDDGAADWYYYEKDESASEDVYDFYAEDAELGDVVFPVLNSNGEIEWSAEIINIEGNLATSYPQPIWFCGLIGAEARPEEPVEPEMVPVEVDRLEMVYRFKVTEDAAVLKIDQHIGEFNDPVTSAVPSEVNGLGLAAKYWSSFSSYSIKGELADGTDVATTMVESGETTDGTLRFVENLDVRTAVDFGGTYVWGRDGMIYEVGTAIIPTYYYILPILPMEYGVPSADLAYSPSYWSSQTYYYCSCYANWDGFSITHDPIFSVFPLTAPGSMTRLIDGLVNSAVLLSVVGVASILVVCVRVNKERRSI